MANGQTFGILPSAQNVLNMPFMGINPFAPAGITDATRQGWLTGLQGLASQYAPAQAYAANMANLAGGTQDWFNQGMQGGFGWNPQMQTAMEGAQQATAQPLMDQAAGLYAGSIDPSQFNLAGGLTQQYMNQPGFGQAAGQIGETLGAYGQPGATTAALEEINQATGGPQTNMGAIRAAVQAANESLQTDFDLTTLPGVNLGAIGAGVGGYGSTRAGVAEGIARRGLADAMQRQTTDMYARAALQGQQLTEQNRQANLQAALQSQQLGGQLGMQGAQNLANIANMQGSLGLAGAGQLADIAQAYGGLQQGAAGGIGNLGQAQGQLDLAASGQIGDLGLASLQAMNQMGALGFGQMLPGAYQAAFQAGQAPGNVMGNIGQMLAGIGGQQQAQNQNVINWYNQAFNNMAQYPAQQLAQYQAIAQPYTSPGTITNAVGPMPPAPSMIGAGLVGAQAGWGMQNLFNQQQQQQQPQGNWGSQAGLGGTTGNWLSNQYGPSTAGTMAGGSNYLGGFA